MRWKKSSEESSSSSSPTAATTVGYPASGLGIQSGPGTESGKGGSEEYTVDLHAISLAASSFHVAEEDLEDRKEKDIVVSNVAFESDLTDALQLRAAHSDVAETAVLPVMSKMDNSNIASNLSFDSRQHK
mmetsp:Transcript_12510/g.15034  ORF Transcript_12510/g.15034 Transcript_12510/m.15034 type:complete len:130 (-) Transcript_12510:295-684(-)